VARAWLRATLGPDGEDAGPPPSAG